MGQLAGGWQVKRGVAVVVWMGLAGLTSSCGPLTGGSSSSSGTPIEQTANAWASAYCNRLFACLPYAAGSRENGANEAECVQRKSGYLKRSLSAPGVSADLSKQDACNTALSTVSCPDFLDFRQGGDGTRIPACSTFAPGDRQTGQGCAYGAQCASGYCNSPEGSCGTCQPFAQAGDLCGVCDFTAGLVCTPGGCFAGRRSGESCDPFNPCFANALCLGGTCQPYLGINASCDPNAGNCSYAVEGLVCNNQTFSCEAIDTSARQGEPCGLGVPSGGMRNCVPGTMCDMTTPTTPHPYSGRCVAGSAAQLGEACLFANPGMNGPACAGEDLQCSNGRCVVADPAACPGR